MGGWGLKTWRPTPFFKRLASNTLYTGAHIRPAKAGEQETIEHRCLVFATSTRNKRTPCDISCEWRFPFDGPVTCWRRRRHSIDINGRRGAAEAQRTVSQEKATTDRALGVSVCLNTSVDCKCESAELGKSQAKPEMRRLKESGSPSGSRWRSCSTV